MSAKHNKAKSNKTRYGDKGRLEKGVSWVVDDVRWIHSYVCWISDIASLGFSFFSYKMGISAMFFQRVVLKRNWDNPC